MKNTIEDRRPIRFSTPDPITHIVIVCRILPDNTEEPIGKVYSDFGEGEYSVKYISTNNNGETLFPPTSDFGDLEDKFEKYSKELSEQSFMEELKAETETYNERKELLIGLRYWKNREKQQINR